MGVSPSPILVSLSIEVAVNLRGMHQVLSKNTYDPMQGRVRFLLAHHLQTKSNLYTDIVYYHTYFTLIDYMYIKVDGSILQKSCINGWSQENQMPLPILDYISW